MRFTVDSNILIYALDRGTPAKHDIAATILTALPLGDNFLAAQVIGEFLAVFRRRFRTELPVALAQAERWHATLPIVATPAEAMLAAGRQSIDHDMQFWDCVIWQTARTHRAAILLSEDMHNGFSHGGLTVINPFAPANAKALDALLKPSS
ncbi:PIN domain-containing protein [Sphingoaurantiacus capsulatus]|uniref:PIN domain-containing protein n=1 Tax=Sphingoaurantiacus capsulatus TaxID=1771310 RepID=A0ABV7XA23_9SPHN